MKAKKKKKKKTELYFDHKIMLYASVDSVTLSLLDRCQNTLSCSYGAIFHLWKMHYFQPMKRRKKKTKQKKNKNLNCIRLSRATSQNYEIAPNRNK